MARAREGGSPGHGAGYTVQPQRTILAVARTITSAVRLVEALEVFHADWRVQVFFAVDDRSMFAAGVDELLRECGARVLPWGEIESGEFDLVLTASENARWGASAAPVVVLPHGVGFHKLLRDAPDAGGVRLSGMVPPELLADKRVTLVVSHEDQRRQLDEVAGAGGQAVVIGDPAWDRIRASLRLRDVYRSALGVTGTQKMVLISSTWGRQSLIGTTGRLPARLLARLPSDEYRIAAVVHPNVWSRHGAWQIRAWLADALDAGLVLLPPTAGWQAAVVASDLIIGDHGSVTFYAAALGRPVLTTPVGDEVAPDTAMAELVAAAPALDVGAPLRPQIDAALAGRGRLASLAEMAFAFPDEASTRLRSFLYGLLEIQEPSHPVPVKAWPIPPLQPHPVESHAVYTREEPSGALSLWRYPAAVDDRAAGRDAPVLRQLVAREGEIDRGLWECASIVVRQGTGTVAEARSWARLQPHAVTAAPVEDGLLIMPRDGGASRLVSADDPSADPVWLAAAAGHLLRAGAGVQTVRLRVAGRELLLRFQSV